MQVIYTAAHSGFDIQTIPLGGGAAVCQHLVEEWNRTQPFPIRVLGPRILGPEAPLHYDLVRYSESRYARFCQTFGQAATNAVLACDPAQTTVLCNDVAEGPDFRHLVLKGFSLFTIYHVDVVDYFTRFYLRGWISPESAARWYARWEQSPLGSWIPSGLKLVFQKQADSARFSRGLIVPSQEMKQVLQRGYPFLDSAKVHVIPWGVWDESSDENEIQRQLTEIRQRYPFEPEGPVLLTLSRISPEKGQDRLLQALSRWEKKSDFPAQGLTLFICGEAAYMRGQKFFCRLQTLAAQLKRTRVYFPGHVTGSRKEAFFRLADLYVFPSRHESYGLTLMEAFRAGLPALACAHYGAHESIHPDCGEILASNEEKDVPELLHQALRRLLSDRARLRSMGEAAKIFAVQHRFSDAAARLATLLTEH